MKINSKILFPLLLLGLFSACLPGRMTWSSRGTASVSGGGAEGGNSGGQGGDSGGGTFTPNGGGFGNNGKVVYGVSQRDLSSTGVEILPDGHIVIAVNLSRGSDKRCGAVMLNSDGSLDTTFGGQGNGFFWFDLTLIGSRACAFNAVLVQGDKTVLGGWSDQGPEGNGHQFLFIRLTRQGTMDVSFGLNGSGALCVVGGASNFDMRAMHFDHMGDIVAAGSAAQEGQAASISLGRLSSNGLPDVEFGPNRTGFFVVDLGVSSAKVNALTMFVPQPAQPVFYIAGTATSGGSLAFIYAFDYNSNGPLNGFSINSGVDGLALYNTFPEAKDIAIQDIDGANRYLAFTGRQGPSNSYLARAQFDSGAIDANFGGQGFVSIEPNDPSDTLSSVALRVDGPAHSFTLLLNETNSKKMVLARFEKSGAVNFSFGSSGRKSFDPAEISSAFSLGPNNFFITGQDIADPTNFFVRKVSTGN